jgi:rfaE bifunctional protein nucleotidyltransferase chain/domain
MKNLPEWLVKKLVEPVDWSTWAEKIRQQGETVATLNGSFDLLHAGHLYIISEAKKQAGRLLVALNSDASIQRYKSPLRPIVPLRYRLEMVAALEFVDAVTWFEEDDPRAFLRAVRPDVHVNGAEYGQECIEASTVREVGGRLHLVDRIGTLATSEVIAKVLACAK